jgi:beta-N-acetylhexosaminidase
MPASIPGAVDAIVAGVQEGRYDASRIERSARHILELKHRLGLDRRRMVDLDSARAIVGSAAHEAVAQRIAERSITLVTDSLGQIPLGRLSTGARVLSVTYARRQDLGAGVTFDSVLRAAFPGLRSAFVDASDSAPDFWRLLQLADSASVVLVSSYEGAGSTISSIAAPTGFVAFLAELTRRGAHPIVVSFGNPYLLQQIPEVPVYVVAWGGFPVSQRAAARAVLGQAPITGRLPISIPPVARLGAGEMRPLLTSGAARSGLR